MNITCKVIPHIIVLFSLRDFTCSNLALVLANDVTGHLNIAAHLLKLMKTWPPNVKCNTNQLKASLVIANSLSLKGTIFKFNHRNIYAHYHFTQ